MKKNRIITRCPVTNEPLVVTKLYSERADITIEGYFELPKINYLSEDKLYFVEVFIKNRGNIKAIEKELNISYPTVKKLLDDVIVELGYALDENEATERVLKNDRFDILKAVEKGEMTTAEALEALKKI